MPSAVFYYASKLHLWGQSLCNFQDLDAFQLLSKSPVTFGYDVYFLVYIQLKKSFCILPVIMGFLLLLLATDKCFLYLLVIYESQVSVGPIDGVLHVSYVRSLCDLVHENQMVFVATSSLLVAQEIWRFQPSCGCFSW